MFEMSNARLLHRVCVAICVIVVSLLAHIPAFAKSHYFDVGDGIAMVRFDDNSFHLPHGALFSPDHKFVAFVSEESVQKANIVKYTIWLWRCRDIENSLGTHSSDVPRPIQLLVVSGAEDSLIKGIQWLDDSSGLIYLVRDTAGTYSLSIVSAPSGTVTPVSSKGQNVTRFYSHNRAVFYTTVSPLVSDSITNTENRLYQVATGRPLLDVLFPGGETSTITYDWGDVWSFDGVRRRLVIGSTKENPLHINRSGGGPTQPFALSPDGGSIISDLPIGKTKPGDHNADALASNYVLIDSKTGRVRSLLNALDGKRLDVTATLQAAWSPDGAFAAVTSTYISPAAAEPCLAVLDMRTGKATCLEKTDISGADTFRLVTKIQFVDTKTLVVSYYSMRDTSGNLKETYGLSRGVWHVVPNLPSVAEPFSLVVDQSLNSPQKLVAVSSRTHASLTLLDPNAWVRSIPLGSATEIYWTDSKGRKGFGALLTPPNYDANASYPLVVQGHGSQSDANKFLSDGSWTQAYAARPLAAAGIVVLQIHSEWNSCALNSKDEVPCELDGYNAALKEVERRVHIDRQKVGMIGFSRTFLYTLATLEDSRFHLAAADISDGAEHSYWEYLSIVDYLDNMSVDEMNHAYGPPFGSNLNNWLEQSTTFRLDRVDAPVRMEAVGLPGALLMWDSYASLRSMNKPVDLIVFKSGTHPLTSPDAVTASEQGSVDWFRFWLRGYEDPDATKRDQYARWEKLCDMKRSQEPGRSTYCVPTRKGN